MHASSITVVYIYIYIYILLAEMEPAFTQSSQSVTDSCNQDGEVLIEILSSPSSYHSNDSISSDETNRLVAASFSDEQCRNNK